MAETVDSRTNLADRLRAARAVRGHTQTDAAIEIGVAVSTLCQWEQERAEPRGLQHQAALRYIAEAEAAQDSDQASDGEL